MRRSIKRTHRELETESYRTTGAARSTFRGSARDPLSVPKRFRAPARFSTGSDGARTMADFALALLDEGCLSDSDEGAVTELVQRGMQNLIATEFGQPKFVEDVELILTTTVTGAQGYRLEDDTEGESWWIGLDLSHAANECCIADKTIELEAAVPGLGQTALDLLGQAAAATTGAWTPETLAYHAPYFLWWGADNQSDWLEEVEAMGASPEDFDMSPDQFAAAFELPWVTNPQVRIRGRRLAHLKSHPNREVGHVASLLGRIERLLADRAAFANVELTDEEPVYRGALVRWRDNDPIQQLLDEWINYANQCGDGFTTLASVWEVGQTQEDVRKWIGQFRQGLKLYKALDELLTLLAVPPGEGNGSDTNQP